MKRLSRILLGLVTTTIPVVIAACYGMAYRFSQRGKVVDAKTKLGVAGLRVECRSQADSMTDRTTTMADGSFSLSARHVDSCKTVAVDDTSEAGARYASAQVPSDEGRELVIEVNPL